MTFKVGIVGCGDIAGWTYLPGTAELADVEIVATCDSVLERAGWAARDYGASGCHAYGKLEDLLADSAVEGVEVVTPWPTHYRLCLLALQAGKHVYVQKPMCETLQEADHLIAEAEARSLTLMAAPPTMVNPVTLRIARLVREGVLGKVAMAYCHSSHSGATGAGRLTDSRWYYKRETGVWTSLTDMGVYGLHAVTGILGPVRRVTAFSGVAFGERTFEPPGSPEPVRDSVTAHDNGILLLDWGDGTLGALDGSFTMIESSSRNLALYGSRGIIDQPWRGTGFRLYQADDSHGYPKGWSEVQETAATRAPGPRVVRDGRPVSGQRPAPDIAHWVRCITEGERPLLSAAHARHVVEIMEKAVTASQTGQSQQLTSTFPDPVEPHTASDVLLSSSG